MPVADWSQVQDNDAGRAANIALAGAGDNSEGHIEDTTYCRHYRRPCTPEEIKELIR